MKRYASFVMWVPILMKRNVFFEMEPRTDSFDILSIVMSTAYENRAKQASRGWGGRSACRVWWASQRERPQETVRSY